VLEENVIVDQKLNDAEDDLETRHKKMTRDKRVFYHSTFIIALSTLVISCPFPDYVLRPLQIISGIIAGVLFIKNMTYTKFRLHKCIKKCEDCEKQSGYKP